MSAAMDNQAILGILIEFISMSLGPSFELALYELEEDHSGTLVQIEFSVLTTQQVGDPLPEDITRLLDARQFRTSTYVTGLTAVFGGDRLANMGILYLHRVVGGKNYILTLMWDSSEYFDMANRLLCLSNLDNKVNLPQHPVELIPAENLIHLSTPPRSSETGSADRNIHDVCIAKIEAAVQEIMGNKSHDQPAYTQEKRTAIVEALYNQDIFKIKGMVREVAVRLFCSDATIYRYLSYINK